MSDDKNAGMFTTTVPVVMDHPNLMIARKFKKNGKESGEAKFEARFNFDPTHPDLAGLKQTMAKVARAKWPARDLGEDAKNGQFAWPIKSGEKIIAKYDAERKKAGKEPDGKYDYLKGKVVLASRSKYEPSLAGVENGRAVDYEGEARKAAEKKFYRGVETLVQVNFVAYEGVGGNPDGVTAYLQKVFTTNKGVKMAGSGGSAAETFKGYVGTATTEDPTAGSKTLDDDIPF